MSTALGEMAFHSRLLGSAGSNVKQQAIAGLIYPSVATNTFGDNLVIRPEVIDNDFEFISAVYLVVEEIPDGMAISSHYQDCGRIQAIEEAFADRDGTLEWFRIQASAKIFRRRPPCWIIRP